MTDNIWDNQYLVSEEAEQYIIGAILKDPKRVLKLCHHFNVQRDWFINPVCRAALTAIGYLEQAGQAVEPVSVLDMIKNKSLSNNVTLLDLRHFESVCTSSHSTLQYIQIVHERFKKRELILHMDDMKNRLCSDEHVSHGISDMQAFLSGISKNHESASTVKDIANSVAEKFNNARIKGCAGIESRWLNIQEILGGYNKGEVCIISALPKQGKTTFACNELYNMAKKGQSVGFISLEMTEEKLRTKMACDELAYDAFKLKNGTATCAEIELIRKTIEKQADLPLHIIDRSKTINQIVSILRDHQDDWDVAAVDYIQKIRPGRGDPHGSVERISNWSTAIANAALDTDIALLVLSQMSREAAMDSRTGKPIEPKAKFLKGSGALEQDLSQLIFIYQDLNLRGENIQDNVSTKVKVDMNRDGQIGICDFTFQKSKQRFVIKGTEMADVYDEEFGDAF